MGTRNRNIGRTHCAFCALLTKSVLVLFLWIASVPNAFSQRTQLKLGWNMFTTQQDIAVGKQNALPAAKQLPLCNDLNVDA